MKNHQPDSAQLVWREEVRSLGSIISARPAVIHHVAGRTAVFNKIHIGHWYILPLTDEEHRFRHQEGKAAFVHRYGSERILFQSLCRFYRRLKDKDLPFDEETLRACIDYRK